MLVNSCFMCEGDLAIIGHLHLRWLITQLLETFRSPLWIVGLILKSARRIGSQGVRRRRTHHKCEAYFYAKNFWKFFIFYKTYFGEISYTNALEKWLDTVIQNVADPRRNGRIGKVFELAEPRFNRDMERDFHI